MGGNGIEILRHGIKIDLYKSLPDELDQFKSMFIEADGNMKNPGLFKRRILGLSSYFKSAQETLMPEFDKDKNIVIKIDMSQYQFGIYESARAAERKQETSNKRKKKKKGPDGELYDDLFLHIEFSRVHSVILFSLDLLVDLCQQVKLYKWLLKNLEKPCKNS